VHFHIYSGNAEDVMDRLDKGMLDFGILIQPVDIAKYNALNLPEKDVWGVAMRRDCPLAKKKRITKDDLLDYPLIFSRQVAQSSPVKNPCIDWFAGNYKKLNIVATYNLIYNAALLVKSGLGVAITLDKLLNVTAHSDLVFRPLEPRLESGLDVVWKKYQVFSAAAELFLSRLREYEPRQQRRSRLSRQQQG
jgi:DNA-binding transcriptional LysR family regulator